MTDKASASAPAASAAQISGEPSHEVVIVGGGAAGIATAASLLRRRGDLDIAIIEPSNVHYYQPGWTMVGGGVFHPEQTRRITSKLIPEQVTWVRGRVATFEPDKNRVRLEDGAVISYRYLVVAPGIQINLGDVEGLADTLGKNGVTSNYFYEYAPYTWQLTQELRGGQAVFTQPPLPFKCAGAPQKAMYLSCDHWMREGVLDDIDVGFYNAGGVLFGVEAYVPALMKYVEKYDAKLNFNHNLRAIDGPAKKAWFDGPDGDVEVAFDMIHICPPQSAPDFIANSPLAAQSGYVDVDHYTLRHNKYENVLAAGDAGAMPNAKTAAAARKQAPVVANNLIAIMDNKEPSARYSGYGACPLTVERGRIVLAEFAYDGKLEPTFSWIDGLQPTRRAWYLKAHVLPRVYWHAMLAGREWLVSPGV